jgi:hypothetical protein
MVELKNVIFQEYILIEGAILDNNTFAFCAELLENKQKGISIAYIFLYATNQWLLVSQVEMQPISVTFSPYDKEEIFVLGREGECARIKGRNITRVDLSSDREDIGPFRKIRNVGESIYVLGEDCSLWMFKPDGWLKIRDELDEQHFQLESVTDEFDEDELFDKLIENTEVAFSFAGSSSNEIYQVGTSGKIWIFNGKKWSEEATPTNVTLSDICRTKSGSYIICGSNGTVIIGESQKWRIFEKGDVANNYFSVTEFLDKIFVADGYSLFKIENNRISRVDFGISSNIPAHFVTTRCEVVLSLAAKEVFISKDGNNWLSLLL